MVWALSEVMLAHVQERYDEGEAIEIPGLTNAFRQHAR
jgi:hypothetical protein